jgi:4-amino-4-deoxy-L-arabinose transferase-like glycosyltransferase
MKLTKQDVYCLITLGVLVFCFYFLRLWAFPLFDVDEPRYAEAAREMIESNNWITPYFNYEVRFDKPVFFYWLIAISYKIFGVSEFAARLPSAIMASLIVFAVFFFGRHFINRKYGFISALVTVSAIEMIGLARMSITDMTLSAFITFMLMTGFIAAHTPEPNKKYWWYAFYIFMGLGALTKGPVAPAMAVIVLGPYFLLTGKFIEVLKTCRLLTGFLLFLLVAAPWYILVIMENGQAYIDQFFLTDNLKRFTSTVSGHKGPIYFFLIVVAVGFIPWSTYLPYALYKYLQPVFGSYKKSKEPNTIEQCDLESGQCAKMPAFCPFIKLYNFVVSPLVCSYKGAMIDKQLNLFVLIWFFTIFIFFSLSGTKLLTYVLPLFPALGLIMGRLWFDYIENEESVSKKGMLISAGILLVVVLVLAYFFVFQFNALMPRDAKVLSLGNLKIYAAVALSGGAIASFIFLLTDKRIFAFGSIIVTMLLLGFIGLYGIVPKVNYAAQGHLNKLIKLSMDYADGESQIITYGLVKPSIVFYTRKRINHIEPDEEALLQEYLDTPERIFILTRVRNLDKLSNFSDVYTIDIGRRFALVTNKKVDERIKKLLLTEENK